MRKILSICVTLALVVNLTLPIIYVSLAYPLEHFELNNVTGRLKNYNSMSLIIDKIQVKVGSDDKPVSERNAFILNRENDESIWVSGNKYSYWVKVGNSYTQLSGLIKSSNEAIKEAVKENPMQLNAWGFLDDAIGYVKQPTLGLYKTHDINLGERQVLCLVFIKSYKYKDSTYIATYYIDCNKFIPVGYILKEDNSKSKISNIWRYEFNYMIDKVDMVKQLNLIKEDYSAKGN